MEYCPANMKQYDFKAIEEKWKKKWEEGGTYEPDFSSPRGEGKFYNLMMFPYPSAEGLHVGNTYAFVGTDIYGRFKRMKGYDVFEPMGLDGFGIHSENYAIKVGTHPAIQARASEKRFYEQLKMIGNGFAWKEKLETYDPAYYRWTQWIFTKMWKAGLAYRKKQEVNWCPSCKTVLSDEQAEGGSCERCDSDVERKDLEQWFFRITKYTERLLENLEKIDWSERVKTAQRNWIGKSEGSLLSFDVVGGSGKIEVFTTRADTLFGVTYMVLAPEHPLIGELGERVSNLGEVEEYIAQSKKKTDEERVENKEKTGVPLEGVKVRNPANGEEIPVWVADYVLGGYGTGAVMAVPAHDDRDFEFAKKFGLPVVQVVAEETGIKRDKEEQRDGSFAVVFDPKSQRYAVGEQEGGFLRLFSGGIEEGEDLREGTLREVTEESGLFDFDRVENMGIVFAHYHNSLRKKDRVARAACFLVTLKSSETKAVKLEDHEKFRLKWVTAEELEENWKKSNGEGDLDHWIAFFRQSVGRCIEWGLDRESDPDRFGMSAYTGEGILINSGDFDGMDTREGRKKVTEHAGGKRHVEYRLRDWLLSRQRYWGPPIPMIFCRSCAEKGKGEQADMPGWYAVPEGDLPVLLPDEKELENFRPEGTGVSPLASLESFWKAVCPGCGGEARRETDVSDTFLDSAWYYIGYLGLEDPFESSQAKDWLPVDMYIGGAEHSVLHLLYVRFLAMALKDMGYVDFEEPFPKFRAHGLLIKEGAKMSKSKGNVVNPDEYVRQYGADVFRMYLMFLAPFEQGGDFRDAGIVGIARFLERVWKFFHSLEEGESSEELERIMHRTVEKVTSDIEGLRYNTGISALMVFMNAMEKSGGVSREHGEVFLKLLAPFAPFITEEIWEGRGSGSIHGESWPAYDPEKLKEDIVTVAVQINGKVRDEIRLPQEASQEDAEREALQSKKIQKFLEGREPRKVIYVPGRILNIVL